MRRCVELASLGLGNIAPNPMVGSLVVHNNKIIGEGYHKIYGKQHAEVNAISDVEDKSLLKESLLYVSLEPCNQHGKTPPCVDLIISSGIKKVVVGCIDPFEKVNGSGIKKLRENGIEVIENVSEYECIELNKRFFTYHIKKRPYIILKWAQSKDGFIAPLHQNETNRWISNGYSQKLVHKWRSEEQGILVGANTAIRDNPRLNAREWHGKNPLRILIDKDLRTPLTHHVFCDGGRTIVFSNKEIVAEKLEVVKINFEKNVITQVLYKLHERNIQSIIVEGGAVTLNNFFQLGLWDEARVFLAQEKILTEGIAAPVLKAAHWQETKIKNDILLTYKNKDK